MRSRSPLHLALAALLGGAAVLSGQGDPPSEPPPPPPNFIPDTPSMTPPRMRPPVQRPDQAVTPATRTPPPPPTRVNLEELAEEATGTSGLLDVDDPRLREPLEMELTVVEMGTNDVLNLLQLLTEKPILRQQNLPAVKITFDTGRIDLTYGQAIRAIESLLALNGIALTRVGDDFIKAVPASIINTQVPVLWEGTTLNAVPTQMIYEKLFQLDYLSPAESVPLIQPLMSQGAPLALEKSGYLLVTDSLINLQRIERVLGVIDEPAELNTEVLFFQLQNIEAQEVLRRLQQIQSGPLSRRLENNTSFDADERTNQLIIFTHPSNVPLFEELIEKMDIDVDPLTTTKVYSIRYAEAVEVVNIIDQVISGQKEVRDERNAAQNAAVARRAAQQQAQQQAANAAAAALRAEASNLQFSDFLTLVADERANNIVASGTTTDLRGLDALIEQIDVLLAQVRIEAVIVEVSLTDNDSSGLDALGLTMTRAGGDASADAPTDADQFILQPGNIGGLVWGEVTWDDFGNFSLPLIVQAVDRSSRGRILSAPTIVTTHNREANIQVGERRPLITGTLTTGTTGATTTQVQYQNIGIELSVTPLIGSNDVIQLEVEQRVEGVGGTIVIDDNEQPIITSRSASSFVSVGDGQLVVLGGLQSVDASESNAKFPILGHVPILNLLFSGRTEDNTRREVILFLRPEIIRTAEEADQVTRRQIDRLESRGAVNEYLRTGRVNDFDDVDEGTLEDAFEEGDEDEDAGRPPSTRRRPGDRR